MDIFSFNLCHNEYLFMKTYGKTAEPSPKTSSNPKVTICHVGIKGPPYKKTQWGQGVYKAIPEDVLAVLSYFGWDFI